LAVNAPGSGPIFPLLGGQYIAGSVQTSMGSSAFHSQVAKLGCAVIGLYPGWTDGGFTMSSAAAAIKALNPNIKLALYTNIMELEPGVGASGSPYSPIYNAAVSGNYFLRTTWPGGSITDADGNAQEGLNQTVAAYQHWRATWSAANEYATNWDALYLDNVFQQPRVSADYAQSGSSQTPSAAGQNWRDGYATYVPLLRAALPGGVLVFGNVADWANGSINGFNQLLDSGSMEGIIGQSWSYESTSWVSMMNYYAKVMQNIRAPGFSIFMQDGSPSDYQAMRYGLCSCLLDNAYYYHSNNGSYDTVELYNEFGFNLGPATAGPGNPTNGTFSSGALAAWQNGVWRRDFANGIALVNPKGNGPRTVTLETFFKHLTGTQAPTVNNGQTVTTITLQDRDGVVMSR
jgi:hypothetical protein